MNTTAIHTIYYLDDSEDEVFLARRILKRTQPALTLRNFERFEEFEAELDSGMVPDPVGSIIVLDLNLKLCSGISCLKSLQERGLSGNTLAGFCTGSEDPADRQEALDAGADFFIPKPLIEKGLELICLSVPALQWLPQSDDGLFLRRSCR